MVGGRDFARDPEGDPGVRPSRVESGYGMPSIHENITASLGGNVNQIPDDTGSFLSMPNT